MGDRTTLSRRELNTMSNGIWNALAIMKNYQSPGIPFSIMTNEQRDLAVEYKYAVELVTNACDLYHHSRGHHVACITDCPQCIEDDSE